MTCSNCTDGICNNMCSNEQDAEAPNQTAQRPRKTRLEFELKNATAHSIFQVVAVVISGRKQITLADESGDLIGLAERARPYCFPTVKQAAHFATKGPTLGSAYKAYKANYAHCNASIRCEDGHYLVPLYQLSPAGAHNNQQNKPQFRDVKTKTEDSESNTLEGELIQKGSLLATALDLESEAYELLDKIKAQESSFTRR